MNSDNRPNLIPRGDGLTFVGYQYDPRELREIIMIDHGCASAVIKATGEKIRVKPSRRFWTEVAPRDEAEEIRDRRRQEKKRATAKARAEL